MIWIFRGDAKNYFRGRFLREISAISLMFKNKRADSNRPDLVVHANSHWHGAGPESGHFSTVLYMEPSRRGAVRIDRCKLVVNRKGKHVRLEITSGQMPCEHRRFRDDVRPEKLS
jgi:hypothetical protein